MITSEQIKNLAKLYNIDNYTIVREYLQLLFLGYLYRNKKAGKIYFKGGTAIKLLFESSRFSEDLDFSTPYNKIQIKQIVKAVERAMQKELPGIRISLLYSGKAGIRFRLKHRPPELKYPLVIRLDFTTTTKSYKIVVSPLVTKFPVTVFPLISHLSASEILTEKTKALIGRNKGRDVFDVWFLLEKGIPFPEKVFNRDTLIKRIKLFPQTQLNRDLVQFLPKSQRKITEMLKEKLTEKFRHEIGP